MNVRGNCWPFLFLLSFVVSQNEKIGVMATVLVGHRFKYDKSIRMMVDVRCTKYHERIMQSLSGDWRATVCNVPLKLSTNWSYKIPSTCNFIEISAIFFDKQQKNHRKRNTLRSHAFDFPIFSLLMSLFFSTSAETLMACVCVCVILRIQHSIDRAFMMIKLWTSKWEIAS